MEALERKEHIVGEQGMEVELLVALDLGTRPVEVEGSQMVHCLQPPMLAMLTSRFFVDSFVGKVMEKAGNAMHSERLAEKGHEKREEKGYYQSREESS